MLLFEYEIDIKTYHGLRGVRRLFVESTRPDIGPWRFGIDKLLYNNMVLVCNARLFSHVQDTALHYRRVDSVQHLFQLLPRMRCRRRETTRPTTTRISVFRRS